MPVSGILLLTLDLLVKATPLDTLSVFSRDPEVSGQRRTRRHHGPAEMAASSVSKIQGIPNVPQVNLPDCVCLGPASSQGGIQGKVGFDFKKG